MKDLNWQIKKRAVWIGLHSDWTYERALKVLQASMIEYLQGHEWSLYVWLDQFYINDFDKKLPFTWNEYESAFVPFKED